MDKQHKKAIIDADWVLHGIRDLTEELRESDSPKDAYKGYELGGRHLKMFVDKSEMEISERPLVKRKRYDGT